MVMFLFACACKVLKIADIIILRGIRVPEPRLTQLYPKIECEIERPCAQIPQFAHAAHAHDGPTISDSERGNCVTIPFSPSMSHMHLAPTASLSPNRGHAEWGCLSPTRFSRLYFGKFRTEWSKLWELTAPSRH